MATLPESGVVRPRVHAPVPGTPLRPRHARDTTISDGVCERLGCAPYTRRIQLAVVVTTKYSLQLRYSVFACS